MKLRKDRRRLCKAAGSIAKENDHLHSVVHPRPRTNFEFAENGQILISILIKIRGRYAARG